MTYFALSNKFYCLHKKITFSSGCEALAVKLVALWNFGAELLVRRTQLELSMLLSNHFELRDKEETLRLERWRQLIVFQKLRTQEVMHVCWEMQS